MGEAQSSGRTVLQIKETAIRGGFLMQRKRLGISEPLNRKEPDHEHPEKPRDRVSWFTSDWRLLYYCNTRIRPFIILRLFEFCDIIKTSDKRNHRSAIQFVELVLSPKIASTSAFSVDIEAVFTKSFE